MRDRLKTVRNAVDVRDGRRDWFRFENLASGELRIDIYDEIGWFGINASQFNEELRQAQADRISLHINSPGGDVFDGVAIYNALREYPAVVNVTVDGIAASIASVIAMSGDEITMARGSMMMIHRPFGMVIGTAEDMRKQADVLDKMHQTLAGIYAERAGGTVEDWTAAMQAETWYSDSEAVAAGLATSVGTKSAVKNRFDMSIFNRWPNPSQTEEASTPPAGIPARWTEQLLRVGVAQLEAMQNGYAH